MIIKKSLFIAIILFVGQLIGTSGTEIAQLYNKDQGTLIDKILEYLPKEAKNNIDEKGMCNGLSSLWAYGMYLSDQPNPENKERDDYSFFKKSQQLLLTKSITEYTPTENSIVDRFIQHVIFFQTWAFGNLGHDQKQLELDITLADTRGRRAVELMDIKLVCTEDMLEKRLKHLTSIPGNMIFIAVQGIQGAHITALYKSTQSGKVFYYDPNNPNGTIEALSVKELLRAVWEATSINQKHAMSGFRMEDMFFRNIEIIAYNFGEKVNFGNLSINEEEKSKMLEAMQRFRMNGLAEVLKGLPTVAVTPQDYAETLQKNMKERLLQNKQQLFTVNC